MDIEKQVCTLQQAKRLKELGTAQSQSYFCWYELHQHKQILLKNEDVIGGWRYDCYAAFTVAELGVMLHNHVEDQSIGINNGYFYYGMVTGYHKTESSVRAFYLIYLLEKGLITAKEVNERLAS